MRGYAVGGVAHGYVHAAPDQNGAWRWWLVLPGDPALEPGGRLCEVSFTADAVSRALARAVEAGPTAAAPDAQPGPAAVAAA